LQQLCSGLELTVEGPLQWVVGKPLEFATKENRTWNQFEYVTNGNRIIIPSGLVEGGLGSKHKKKKKKKVGSTYYFFAVNKANSYYAEVISNKLKVVIVSSRLLARISGGDRQHWVGQELELDGELLSRDFNKKNGSVTFNRFHWDLLIDGLSQDDITNYTNLVNFSWPMFITNASKLYVGAYAMVIDHVYTWVLTITDPNNDNRVGMDSIDVHVSDKPFSMYVWNALPNIYATTPISLQGIVQCTSCHAIWWKWFEISSRIPSSVWSNVVQNASYLTIKEYTFVEGLVY
ncbi:hypothetical protein RFI_12674, partial [Reticulomyxa filosa]